MDNKTMLLSMSGRNIYLPIIGDVGDDAGFRESERLSITAYNRKSIMHGCMRKFILPGSLSPFLSRSFQLMEIISTP